MKNKNKYSGIIFDLDGTLIDSQNDIVKCVNLTIKQLGLSPLPLEDIHNSIGSGVPNLLFNTLKQALGDDPSRLLEVGIDLFRTYYEEHLLDETICYTGVRETLIALDNFQKGVVTNKPKHFSSKIIKGLEIDSFFSFVIGGDEVNNKKPDPEGVLKALEVMKLSPDDVLMVGDSYADVESGEKAGVNTCFVTYGIGKLKKTKPHFIIDSFDELKDLIDIG